MIKSFKNSAFNSVFDLQAFAGFMIQQKPQQQQIRQK